MTKHTKADSFNYLISPIEYLLYHLKMKMIEHLFKLLNTKS